MTSKKSRSPAVRARRDTRSLILDAAEGLFTHKGYNGTSVRAVALEAGIPLGVFGYHLASKYELFQQVIARRSASHVADVCACLDAAIARGAGRTGDIEDIIRSYLTPSTERYMRGGTGWRNYIQLVGRSMSLPYYEKFLEPLAKAYDPVVKRLYELVREAFPAAEDRRLHWAIYFLQAIYIHLIIDSRIVDRQSAGACKSSDLDAVMDELVPFLAAAFRARLGPSPTRRTGAESFDIGGARRAQPLREIETSAAKARRRRRP
ncbi:MAG: TetR/AcrR family transcriptional regulator [Dehalococcoidia bacterium]